MKSRYSRPTSGRHLLLPILILLLVCRFPGLSLGAGQPAEKTAPAAAVTEKPATAAHGISIDGKLKYPADFKRFAYASAAARPGGNLLLHALGGFDKMNPFTLKGTAPEEMSELIFESLAAPSLDEPFAAYGLLAESFELAEDRLSITFNLRPEARFSDHSPVTAEDVRFSLETFKGNQAHPFYQHYFHDISRAEVLGPHRIRFHFARPNRELHLIAAQMPVLSRKFYDAHPFNSDGLTPPVGSGPYLVESFAPGKTITYRRNPDYWGKELGVRQGMFNFETITFKYFKDQIVALEAFKAGEFDFMAVNIARQWARDLEGERFRQGELLKLQLPHMNNAGMQAFVFNTRRSLFQDRKVRQALNLAFDFEWTNQTMFFNQYRRCDSYFSNSYLAARDLPQGLELSYLEPFRKQLPAEVFNQPLTPFSTEPPHSRRANLIKAARLLKEAGWQVKEGMLTHRDGRRFEFEILLNSTSFERVMAPYAENLSRLGIKASYRTIDQALYVRRLNNFDFDMVVTVFGQSQSPGNEQRDLWHSTAAERPGSRNLIGLQEPAVDDLVEKIIYAQTQEELTAAAKALDRVLWYGYYVVPNWYLDHHRITVRNRFARPDILPLYYNPFQVLMTWWMQ